MWGSVNEKQEFGLLYLYFYGTSEERNYGKAIKTIKKLAINGYIPAIFTLGFASEFGHGIRKNDKMAFENYMRAAEEGYPSAECGVANYYMRYRPKHNACEHNPQEAVKWYIRAARHGNPGAQCNLAGLYLTGQGVEKDPEEAYLWANMAVYCSSIRFRSAEVYRDQAAALIDFESKGRVEQRCLALKDQLPYDWSEHSVYWRKLWEEAQGFEDM